MKVSPERIRWAWRMLTLVSITALAIAGVHEVSVRQESDRRSNREFCIEANKRTQDLKDLFNGLIREPRAEEYAFIEDPQLREGVLIQSKARYAEMKEKLNAYGKPRDCQALYPQEE